MRDEERVILVDGEDRELGTAGKLVAHQRGQLHRAISVCVVDQRDRMLLQRRALAKYHSGGLWTNACCTHPRPGETPALAARRRLMEELGVDCDLNFLFRTEYRAPVSDGLIEHEVVHVFHGVYAGVVTPNPNEVGDYRWADRSQLLADLATAPQLYTYWFRHYVSAYGDTIFKGPSLSAA